MAVVKIAVFQIVVTGTISTFWNSSKISSIDGKRFKNFNPTKKENKYNYTN